MTFLVSLLFDPLYCHRNFSFHREVPCFISWKTTYCTYTLAEAPSVPPRSDVGSLISSGLSGSPYLASLGYTLSSLDPPSKTSSAPIRWTRQTHQSGVYVSFLLVPTVNWEPPSRFFRYHGRVVGPYFWKVSFLFCSFRRGLLSKSPLCLFSNVWVF